MCLLRKLLRVCKFHLGLNVIRITYFLKKKKNMQNLRKTHQLRGRNFFFFCFIIFYVRICILTGEVGHSTVRTVKDNSKLKHQFSKPNNYIVIYLIRLIVLLLRKKLIPNNFISYRQM